MLTLKLLIGVKIVGFVDNVVLSVSSETQEEIELLAIKAVDMIQDCLLGAKLPSSDDRRPAVL